MKRPISFLITIVIPVLLGYSQKPNHLISASFSNNGQMASILESAYPIPLICTPGATSFLFVQNNPKFNLRYEVVLPQKILLTAKLGFASREGNCSSNNEATSYYNQQVYQIALGAKYYMNIGKFQISTGGEIPFFYASRYYTRTTQTNPDYSRIDKATIEGGYSIGLNSSTSVKVFIGSRFFLFTEVAFGLQYSNLGGKYLSEAQETAQFSTNNYSWEQRVTYQKFTITPPELEFGFGLKIK